MGLCLGKTTTAASPCWLDLPLEIAGEILSRLPTDGDRLNFKSICRQWHLAASQQGLSLPPAVPCINLGNGVYQSIVTDDNGTKVHRRRFARPTGFRAGTTFGSWVLYENRRSHQFFLRDPLSPSTPAIQVPCGYDSRVINPETVDLYMNCLFTLKKIIVCLPHLVVALTGHNIVIDSSVDIACFRPESTVVLWHTRNRFYMDIALHRGKVFSIDSNEQLFSHWLVGGEAQSHSPTNPEWFFKEAPSQSRTEHVIKEGPAIVLGAADRHYQHLVTSYDEQKLLMVRWGIRHQTNDNEADNREMNLQVFEAELDKGKWSEVKNLGSQVLFVGKTGSRAFVAQGLSEHYFGQKFAGGNCVFVLGKDWALAHGQRLGRQKFPNGSRIPSYCAYDMATGKTSIVSLNGGHDTMKSSMLEWFFPSK